MWKISSENLRIFFTIWEVLPNHWKNWKRMTKNADGLAKTSELKDTTYQGPSVICLFQESLFSKAKVFPDIMLVFIALI